MTDKLMAESWVPIDKINLIEGERYLLVAHFSEGAEVICSTYIPCETDDFWWETGEVRTNKEIITHAMPAPKLPPMESDNDR